ncbi:zn 2cys6 transcription factor [Colletotrichum karsti]|uniref:Endo-chitosanase n=1 Tax=Colletotrichum karsti TaxID=1095194 RepID=A0A9P6I843_9PEZI|nr:zn 2cys6 transcription factor [Colletotrichum karsti]KAF9877999.1 zn 2cys6 transcription factor [Colletotrichum karsti]
MVIPRAGVLLAIIASVAPSVLALEIPSNVKDFYDHVRNRGECRHELKGGFHSMEGDSGDFGYCGDYLDDYKIMYIQGKDGQLANMDIDCDGAQTSGDGRCQFSTDTQSQTTFMDTLGTYGKGDLNSYIHPYVVFGNSGTKSGWPNFDPQEHGVEPLSIMAVVCNNSMYYGIWGDTNGDDGPQAMVGEASISLATACFGNGVHGNQGHDINDVLYIAFTGNDAVPGATGANWSASNADEFSKSINALVFMGTSSNWAFGRRVLTMTHEAVTGTPLRIDDLFFDAKVYDLKWDGSRTPSGRDDFSPSNLPTQDFAIYLINSFKFRCGRLFYLFEEESFMKQFAIFHESGAKHPDLSRLWYVHYLIILAFGKAFVVQTSRSQTPPGLELFVQAMKLMPDFTFFHCDFVEKAQVLCSAALYLHCLSCRTSAYRYISQAISLAFEGGMYTEMQGQYLDDAYVQRCRMMWWTIYVLERHFSTLLGVPLFIQDENICTPYPSQSDQGQRASVMQVQVKLAQIMGQIHRSVYGIDGQLDSRYLSATKSLLQSMAGVAGQLNDLFDINSSENTAGVSRCIVLTTRPLLFIFLQSRLGQSQATPMRWAQSESVRGLLQVCMESCCQIIKILSRLLNQGLLENFLAFDLDAAFTATIAILMGGAIDPTLLPDYLQLIQRAYTLFDEMTSHGNKIAGMIVSELKQLEGYLSHLQANGQEILPLQDYDSDVMTHINPNAPVPDPQDLGIGLTDDFEFGLHFELSTEQLMQLADSLDIDSLSRPMSASGSH